MTTPGITRWTHEQPAVLVANPTAHSGKAADWIRHARALLDHAGVAHRFVPTEPEGATIERVREAIDDAGARAIIYMGGDGTFAEVAKGILASQHAPDIVMGMLPTGTANDQGKSFGLEPGPGQLERNVAVVAAGEVMPCDVGRLAIERAGKEVHRDLFFDSFSIGLGAASLATRNRDRERVGRIPGLGAIYRDQLVYIGAVVQRFVESYVVDVKFDLDAVIDGASHAYEHLIDVIIKNTRVFGGEWVFDDRARSDDGRFELVPIAGRRDFTAKLLGTLRHGPIGLDDLQRVGIEVEPAITGARFELAVHGEGGVLPAAQCDGEELPAGELYRIAVVPRALRLIVPAA
ncbi:MAG TPA: diacylglycerol kinase family protein [Kofleriaceae bacterium]|nr:diacylglycerol kinase family protein [Kofleriaceae bacterium]